MAATATQPGKSQPHVPHRKFSSPDLKPLRTQRLPNREMAGGERRSAPPAPARDSRCAPTTIGGGDDDGGLKELREKLLGHLREAADKMKIGMPTTGPSPQPPAPPALEKAGERAEPSAAGDSARPWNLRTRRTARRAAASPALTVRLRSEDSEIERRRRFSVSLSREEIEEDIFALTGSRPRLRPKKRLRSVQWRLDAIFPGLWLSEITPALYKVAG